MPADAARISGLVARFLLSIVIVLHGSTVILLIIIGNCIELADQEVLVLNISLLHLPKHHLTLLDD